MSVFKTMEGISVKNQTLLLSAVKSGDTTLLQHLLDKSVSVHTQCSKGYTPLHYAVMSQNITNIELLLKKGASIYFPDQSGKTALDLAVDIYSASKCEQNPKSAILVLLLSYTLLDEETTSTFTFLAVEKNDEELLKFFLKKDPATRIHSTFQDNRSLLHVAAEMNHTKLIKVLLEHGADINAKTFSGETALHLAAGAGNVEVAQQLIYSGLSVDSIDNNGSIPLHYAIRNNRRNIILLLTNLPKVLINRLNHGVSSNPSLLHYAVIKNDEEFFNLALKNSQVDLNAKTKDGETPLHFAIVYNRLKLIYELVKRGADVNVQSSNGETPLHFAAAMGQAHLVEFLLRQAANVNGVTTSGSTPLHYALDRERCNDIVGGYNRPLSLLDDLKPRFTIVKTLLRNRAVANFRDHSGKTPLHYAMAMGIVSKNNIKYRIDTIRCLVNHGADVNALCNNKRTPLFYGFEAMDEKMLWWLIRRGANLMNNNSVDSFLSKAIKFKNLKMIDVLLEAGMKVTTRNIFEASFVNEIDKSNYFEILEMLANRTDDVKSVVTKISQFIDSEWQLKASDKEDIMNKLSAILIRREILGEIIIKHEDFELDDNSERNLRNRFSACRDQISKMKKVSVNNEGLTLYNVFMASINQLANYVQNQELKTFLYSNNFSENFPNCSNLLQSRYKKARIKNILLDFSSKSLLNLVYKGFNVKLPLSVGCHIVQYLSSVDLTHLMQFRCNQASASCPTARTIIIKN